jgi:hypothetical protein
VGLVHLSGMVFQPSIQSGIFKISINFNEVLEKRSEDSKHFHKNNQRGDQRGMEWQEGAIKVDVILPVS